MLLSLSAIYIYPIKSLGGIAVDSALIEEKGLQYDRRWMVIDAQNQFMTQRKFAKMALLKVSIEEGKLRVTAPDMPSLNIPVIPQTSEILPVTVWNDTSQSIVVSNEANEWFSIA